MIKVEAEAVCTDYFVSLGNVERKPLISAVMKIRDVEGVVESDWLYRPSSVSFTLQSELDDSNKHVEIKEIIEGEINQ